jgi:hypothetical protein
MATFFVLPPRERIEQALVEFVNRVLPGLSAPPAVCDALLTALELEANRPEDVYFVHREELLGDVDLITDLTTDFGAEPGDQVCEIHPIGAGHLAGIRRLAVPFEMSESQVSR